MGTVLGQSINESKKIDIDLFLSKYSKNYKLESYLRDDIFKTLLVISKEHSEFESGIPFVIKLFPIENDNYLKYSQEFEDIKNQYSNLESNPNLIPIIKLDQMKEANVGIILRQYIQYNLKQALYYLTCSLLLTASLMVSLSTVKGKSIPLSLYFKNAFNKSILLSALFV